MDEDSAYRELRRADDLPRYPRLPARPVPRCGSPELGFPEREYVGGLGPPRGKSHRSLCPLADTTDDHTLLWLLNHIRVGIPELIVQVRHHRHTRAYAFFVTATYERRVPCPWPLAEPATWLPALPSANHAIQLPCVCPKGFQVHHPQLQDGGPGPPCEPTSSALFTAYSEGPTSWVCARQ